jgi:hypothetical protein
VDRLSRQAQLIPHGLVNAVLAARSDGSKREQKVHRTIAGAEDIRV